MKLTYLSALALITSVVGQSTVLHPNGNANKCLDVREDARANGTPVQIFDCNGTPAQQWELTLGNTAVRLANSTFCLDAGASPANGTPMKIWQCFDNLPAQEWVRTTNAKVNLRNTNFCLDLTNGNLTNTNVVQIWSCVDGNTNQIWTN